MKNKFSLIKLIRFILIIVIASAGIFYMSRFTTSGQTDIVEVALPKQGTITILNLDEKTAEPIPGSEYTITELNSGKTIQTIVTDQSGKAVSKLLDYNRQYQVAQNKIMAPYELTDTAMVVDMSRENHRIVMGNTIPAYVTGTFTQEDGTLGISGIAIPVADLMQNPELPNGCEITALTAVLNAYGYPVSKTEMADDYLTKEPFVRVGNQLMGADPIQAFAGDPRSESGFYVFGSPIAEAANGYLQEVGGHHTAYDLSGSSQEEILGQLNQGNPVVIWVTLDLSQPKRDYSWYLAEAGEEITAFTNLHAVVLRGYNQESVVVMDPLRGEVWHPIDSFFQSYQELGTHAVVVVEE